MTASTLVRPLPESAEPDYNTTEPRPAHTPAPATSRRTPTGRRDHGFSMLELLIGMVILGVLGAIGYGVYTNFIADARDTALDQNIQTAASELQSAVALNPTITVSDLVDEMTARTSFDWTSTWAFGTSNEPTTIRLQYIIHDATDPDDAVAATPAAAPTVGWGIADQSAIRVHLANAEQEWRCALIVLRPSAGKLAEAGTGATAGFGAALDDDVASSKAAQMRGIWYDGGSVHDDDGLHDCSPVSAAFTFGAWRATPTASTTAANGLGAGTETTCAVSGTTGAVSSACLPANAQTWHIPATGELDATSTAVENVRTLHRSTSALDDNG